jgi:hypothetical protein
VRSSRTGPGRAVSATARDALGAGDGGPVHASSARRRALLAMLPFAAMAVIAGADALAGPAVGLLALFSLGPAFASTAGSVRRAAAVGALAFALCTAAAAYDGLWVTRRHIVALCAVIGVTGASMLATQLRWRTERELADVRLIAETAQRVLLRLAPRQAGTMRVAVSYTSAATSARIGGDLYEVTPAPNGSRVIVGDVQGKGLEAVETAAVVLGAFRESAPYDPTLTTVGDRLERALNRHLDGEQFVTAVLVEIHDDRTISLINYGHPAPLLLRADGTVEFAEPPVPAPPLGLAVLAPARPTTYHAELRPGDQMLLYTDGVTKARDRNRRFYPLHERAHLLSHPDPDHALESLRRDLIAHVAGPLGDDAAMLLLRYRTDQDTAEQTHHPQ